MSALDTTPVRCGSTAGTGNVRPLLYEIRHALERLVLGGEGTVIDLQRLPLAPGEEARIESFLGTGEVRAQLDALGPTVVQETAYPGVWFVTHRNLEDQVVARFIEVSLVPDVIKAQTADMVRGIERIAVELDEEGDIAPRKAG